MRYVDVCMCSVQRGPPILSYPILSWLALALALTFTLLLSLSLAITSILTISHLLLLSFFPHYPPSLTPYRTIKVQNGVLARPTHANTAFDDARLEVCAQRFAAMQEGDYGVALINDCKYV